MKKHLALASFLLLPTLAGCAPVESTDDENPDSDAEALKVCAKGATVKGIDVSKWQGAIDWKKVKAAGIGFAIVRVGDGDTYVDPRFGENWAGTKANGILRGTYQFFRPGDDPVKAADLFVNQINAHGGMKDGDLPPVLDVEVQDGVSDATLRANAVKWLERVEQKLGRRPMIYTSPGFWNGVGASSSFSKYPLWVAHWETQCPTMPNSWSGWKFWQTADDGHVNGISGAVDTNLFNGSLAELKAFAGATDTPPPPPATGLASLGGKIADQISVGKNADGRLEVFAVGPKGNMLTSFQEEPNGDWSEWFSMGGNLDGAPAVGNNQDGRLEIFARDAGKAMVHAWQDAPNGKIGNWATLGGTWASDPTLAKNSDGRLELFAVGTDGAVHHVSQIKANGGWSSWASLGKAGGGLLDARAVRGEDGKLRVFARGKDEKTYVAQQKTGGYTGWTSLGGTSKSAPTVVLAENGALALFARGSDGALWHKWENTPGGTWSAWISLGGGVFDPVATVNTDGKMEVFVRGNNDALYRVRQKTAGGAWETFTKIGGAMKGAPAVGRNKDGRLEVFIRASDDSVKHAWQTAPSKW